MNNYSNDNTARRYKAHISTLGSAQIHLRSPFIIAWWSAAFPGVGHLLLSKNLRGFVLFVWEVFVNIHAHVNGAMIYSFQGKIDMAKSVLDTRWMLIYIPVYLFGIWDSYRTTVDLNKVSILADREDHQFNTFSIDALEINHLDKRKPIISVFWSMWVPGLGELYIHRIIIAFFIIIWTVVFYYFSHAPEAVSLLFLGKIKQATSVLKPEWFLFLPSVYGFSMYDSYINTVENNKLFDKEQTTFLKSNYQNPNFEIIKGTKVE